MRNKNIIHILALIAIMIYVISPADALPGPVDDMLLCFLFVCDKAKNNTQGDAFGCCFMFDGVNEQLERFVSMFCHGTSREELPLPLHERETQYSRQSQAVF